MKLKLETIPPHDKTIETPEGMVAFKIVEQEGFQPEREYIASNGVKLESYGCPSVNDAKSQNKLFVRGSYKDRDNRILFATKEYFTKIQFAIKEILERENAPKFIKEVTFMYCGEKGGAPTRRMLKVQKEDDTHISGIDSDKNEYRNFLKSRIGGKISTVTE